MAVFSSEIGQKFTLLFHRQIHFHGKDMSSLHKYINADCLTARYQGTIQCEEIDGKHMADLFEFYNKEYEIEYSYGYSK